MTTPNTQLATIQPAELVRQATDISGLCKQIVLKSSMEIQGRKFVKVEGWMSLATAHGCIASARDVERVEGGFRAIGEIRRLSDGVVLSTAEGFVGEDEPVWFGGPGRKFDKRTKQWVDFIHPKRPDYAIRSMCSTRAISKVCRTAFAHVIVMMDCGLSTTPADEVPEGGFDDGDHNAPPDDRATRQRADEREGASDAAATVGNWKEVEVHFGKNKGKKLAELSAKTVLWYRDAMVERRDDPAPKYPMGVDDRRLLAACEMALLELNPSPGTKPATAPAKPQANPRDTLKSMLGFDGKTTEDELIAAAHQNGLNSDIESISQMSDQEAQTCITQFDKLTCK